MSYEKSTIESNSAVPSAPTQQIKEERVVDPYAASTRLARAQEAVAGQTRTNEMSPVEEPTPTVETVTLSPQVAALARKEQRFRQQQQTLKQREAALAEREAKLGKLADLDSKLAAKDYSAIEDKVNYDEYTNYLLNKNANLTPDQQELKRLAAEMDSVKKANQDNISKQFEAAVEFRRKAVVSLVESNKDFKRIKGLGAQEAVVQHILSTWEHDEVDLSPEDAAKEVEELLKEKEAKWLSISKEDEPAIEAVDQKKPLPPLKSGVKTLSNNMAPTGDNKKPLKSLSQMNESERYAEARRRAEEKLKLTGRI